MEFDLVFPVCVWLRKCLIESVDGGQFEQESEKSAGLLNRLGGAPVYLAAQWLPNRLLKLLVKQRR
jgi:hypothetical protein